MLIKEENVLQTSVIFSQDKTHRYLLKKQWDDKLPKVTIIMLNPSRASSIRMDMTTFYTVNNIADLNYGAVEIVDLYSNINTEIKGRADLTAFTDKENDKQILASVAGCDIAIIAWGKITETNKNVKQRTDEIIKLLNKYKQKLHVIEDKRGRKGWHPLAPSIRNEWKIIPYK